jgi:hypothetical protein
MPYKKKSLKADGGAYQNKNMVFASVLSNASLKMNTEIQQIIMEKGT